MKKLCIIGAGVSGLCSVKRALEYGCEVMAFEQSADIGGTWVYREEIGLNVHSSMYKGLTTDIPKEVMCFPDYPYSNKIQDSYIPSERVLSYLNDYASEFNLFEKIKFEHCVVRVRPIHDAFDKNDKWEVIVRDLKNGNYNVHVFDAVLVCTGNFHTPFQPHFPGHDLYRGKQIHSHDYRDEEPYRDERVLLIGAGPTGIDLVKEVAKTARAVTWSTHLKQKLNIQLADNVTIKPDVCKLTVNGATFVDGTENKYSIVLYCTGYTHSFPFLSVDCGIVVEENFVSPLYKHCLSINRPTLGFIGLPTVVCNNQVFDYQARFCLAFMTQQLIMPAKEVMLRDFEHDMNERWKRGLTKRRAHMMGFDVQEKYFQELSELAKLEPVKPVIMKIFNKSIMNLFADLNSYRNKKFKVVDDEVFEEQ